MLLLQQPSLQVFLSGLVVVVKARKVHQWQSEQRVGMKKPQWVFACYASEVARKSFGLPGEIHHPCQNICRTDAVPEDSPAAAEAMKAYRKLTSG